MGLIILLLSCLKLALESGEVGDITKSGDLLSLDLLANSSTVGSGSLLGARLALLVVALTLLESTRVRDDDTLLVLVELDNLEGKLLIDLGLSAVLLDEVARSCKALYTVGKCDDSALVDHLSDSTLVDRADSEDGLEDIPRILLELLVTKAETTVLLVYIEYDDVDVSTGLRELARMLDLLGPREV